MRAIPKSECIIPYINTRCYCAHNCAACEIADRYRLTARRRVKSPAELFGYYDVLPKTEKGGGREYVYKPLILRQEAMERAGIAPELYNQIFIATGGAGMFSHNEGSEIDGYLVGDRRRTLTFGRREFYGIPNERARERYRRLFLIDLENYMRGGGAYDLSGT
ncbi:MAG: hypothetical protein IJ038_05175 [Clostridia bacterium]|nr:hypothetical protein [Clostridia bacterium]